MKKQWVQNIMGRDEDLEGRYRRLYGEGDYQKYVREQQKQLWQRYAAAIGLVVVLMLALGAGSRESKQAVTVGAHNQLLSIRRPAAHQRAFSIEATVNAVSDRGRVETEKQLTIQPKGNHPSEQESGLLRRETEQDRLERKISTAVRSLNQNTSSDRVVLPDRLEDGTRLTWTVRKDYRAAVIFFVGILLLFVIWKGRFRAIDTAERQAKRDIIKELPGFLNKLVLLLNAGVVFTAAIERVIEEEHQTQGEGNHYFYDRMRAVMKRVKETRSPFQQELSRFARQSGVREMMRLSNILTDNLSKGTELTEKLQRESRGLWFSRKKQSEEKGRLAETRLTLPLVILLLVLVMITIAPALLDI